MSSSQPPQPGGSSAPNKTGQGLSLNTLAPSPVTVNGSYEFDKVLKCGIVNKRTRRTKSWKPIYLVLRPGSISIYKDEREAKLRQKINVTDLTAVCQLKDPKGKRLNLFGLFSPSRNYHLEAPSKKDQQEWIELVRKEARIEEVEEEMMILASPAGVTQNTYTGLDEAVSSQLANTRISGENLISSSPEPIGPVPAAKRTPNAPTPGVIRRPSHFDYSGNEPASYSEMSDTEPHIERPHPQPGVSASSIPEDKPMPARQVDKQPYSGRNTSQMSGLNNSDDPERIVWQGHLLWLRSKSGMRQWKNLWAVLRAKSITLYKNEDEYAPILIINMNVIVNVVEIDPISKTKKHCLQIITEEKSYRFCAISEESLDRALGGFKSLLAKRRPELRSAATDIPAKAI